MTERELGGGGTSGAAGSSVTATAQSTARQRYLLAYDR